MRGDPVDALADGGSAFDVGLLLRTGVEELRQISEAGPALPAPIDVKRVVLVVTDDKVVGIERDGRPMRRTGPVCRNRLLGGLTDRPAAKRSASTTLIYTFISRRRA